MAIDSPILVRHLPVLKAHQLYPLSQEFAPHWYAPVIMTAGKNMNSQSLLHSVILSSYHT